MIRSRRLRLFTLILALALIAAALSLQVASRLELLAAERVLVKYGLPVDNSYGLDLEVDYKLCYSYDGGFENATLIVYYDNLEIREPLRVKSCIDMPWNEVNFTIPIIIVNLHGLPINIPYSEVETLEPGVIAASYNMPGLGLEKLVIYRLQLEELKVTTASSGSYRLIIELLKGFNVIDVRTVECNGECTLTLKPGDEVTSYNVRVLERRLDISTANIVTLALLILAAILALYLKISSSIRR